jgi:hypothetical protein
MRLLPTFVGSYRRCRSTASLTRALRCAGKPRSSRAGYRINPHLCVYANAADLLDQQRFHFYGGSVIGRRVLAG